MLMNATADRVLTVNVRTVLASTAANVRKALKGSTVNGILMNVSATHVLMMVGTAGHVKTKSYEGVLLFGIYKLMLIS